MRLQVAKADILAGEPIIVLVTLKGQAALDLEADLTFPAAPFKILIDRGHGFVPYVEKSFWPDDQDLSKTPLANGEERLEYVLSVDDATGDWIFLVPGAYPVVAEYHDDTLGPVRSNVVTVNVRAPSGEEKTVHDALRARGPSVLGDHHAGWAGELVDLIQAHPRSVYLQEPRLLDLRFRQHNVIDGYDPMADPDTEEYPPPRPNFLPGVQKAWFESLLPAAEELATTAGQLEPDALLELGGIYQAVGETDRARSIFGDIVERFPLRKAAVSAREALGDITPPRASVQATPATLWPPNHKLVRIAATVTVSDDMDPAPTVALKSITCDDACGAAQDIVGAELGTDDRAFELRAERKGSGAGRTYTITYSATDASGNQATAVTTVVVPHDQGK
jgi:hypothetical protein